MYIYKAGVVGAGTMGAEIAQTISYGNLPVVIKDVEQSLVEKGLEKARDIYRSRVEKGRMKPEEAEQKISLISGTTSYDAFKDVDIVVEAVPENLELKQKVLKELDEVTPEHTILATNTSSLSISAIGAATKRPDKVVGLHFFFPAHVMRLVEVIPGLDTSDETVQDTITFGETLRKIPVRVKECPGFLINRLLFPYLNEAAYCLQEGTAPAMYIDQMATAWGFPMGPFFLMDALGLDIAAEVARVLYDGYGPRMGPARLMTLLVEQGRKGQKTRAGVYDYAEGWPRDDDGLKNAIAQVQQETGVKGTKFSMERLVLPMLNEAALCVEEGICGANDMEIALLAGIGFPRDKKGILHWGDSFGLDGAVDGLKRLSAELGFRFWPAPLLKRMVGAGHLGKKTGRGFFTY
jgi:3-hydroxyacyl-CoA dehydrogenase